MSQKIRCPKCGAEAAVKSENNPIRNVVRSTLTCRSCGYSASKEHPPDVTLGEWLGKK